MVDPIKEKLKQSTKEKIKGAIHANLPGQGTNLPVRAGAPQKGIMRRMYEVGRPVHSERESHRVADLEIAVYQINEGQRHLEKIRRMDRSPVYRGWVHFADKFKGVFGATPTRTNIYELFRTQQNNVRQLNFLLASMVGAYEGDIKITRGTLDNLIEKVTTESLQRKKLENVEIPPEIQRYEDAVAKLNEIGKDQEPEKYYAALQEVIGAKRVSRKKRFDYTVVAMGQEHHGEQVNNLMLQEELFETMLYRVMEMACRTELYQETLDHNARIWESIQEVSYAVSQVSGGVTVLEDFKNQLNDSYINAVKEISQIVDNHPGAVLLTNTNSDLRQLVADVNASAYRSAAQYDRVLPTPENNDKEVIPTKENAVE